MLKLSLNVSVLISFYFEYNFRLAQVFRIFRSKLLHLATLTTEIVPSVFQLFPMVSAGARIKTRQLYEWRFRGCPRITLVAVKGVCQRQRDSDGEWLVNAKLFRLIPRRLYRRELHPSPRIFNASRTTRRNHCLIPVGSSSPRKL